MVRTLVLSIIALVISSSGFCEDYEGVSFLSYFKKTSIGLTIGNNVVNVGKKARLSGDSEKTAEGTLISDKSVGVIIETSSSFTPFANSNFGYMWSVNYESFQVDTQSVPRAGSKSEKNLDLGTSARGHSFFVTPILVYNLNFLETHNLFFGVGLGLGYMKLSGDVYLTENTVSGDACSNSETVAAIQQNCTKKEIDEGAFTYTRGWAIGYETEHFGTRIKRTGPQIKKSDTAYTIWVTSWDFYYTF